MTGWKSLVRIQYSPQNLTCMLKKIFFYVFIPVYLFACLFTNSWHTGEGGCGDLDDFWCPTTVSFTSVEKGDYSSSIFSPGEYEIKAVSANSDYGFIFIDTDHIPVPKKIELNKQYKVELDILEAHSWKDFFLMGTCYDAQIMAFHDIKTEELSDKSQEIQKKLDENTMYWDNISVRISPHKGVIITGLVILLICFLILKSKQKKVHSTWHEINGQVIFNRPSWMEFTYGIYYLIIMMFWTYASIITYQEYYVEFADIWYVLLPLLIMFWVLNKFIKEIRAANCKIICSKDEINLVGIKTKLNFKLDKLESISLYNIKPAVESRDKDKFVLRFTDLSKEHN